MEIREQMLNELSRPSAFGVRQHFERRMGMTVEQYKLAKSLMDGFTKNRGGWAECPVIPIYRK